MEEYNRILNIDNFKLSQELEKLTEDELNELRECLFAIIAPIDYKLKKRHVWYREEI